MNKTCATLLTAASGMFLTLSAANDSIIVTTDGRVIKTSKIEVTGKGDLQYLTPDGKLKNRIPNGRFRYAQVPKPGVITEADQNFRKQQWKTAAAMYHKAASDYRLLGWEVYCIRMEAESLANSGEKAQAEKLLTDLPGTGENNPRQQKERNLADNFLAELLIDRKQFDAAEKILNRQLVLDDPELVFSAFFKKAEIMQGRGQRKEALRLYYQTFLLFPGNPRRAEALYNTWNLMQELKDPRAGKIAELLKREYPGSPLAKKVSF